MGRGATWASGSCPCWWGGMRRDPFLKDPFRAKPACDSIILWNPILPPGTRPGGGTAPGLWRWSETLRYSQRSAAGWSWKLPVMEHLWNTRKLAEAPALPGVGKMGNASRNGSPGIPRGRQLSLLLQALLIAKPQHLSPLAFLFFFNLFHVYSGLEQLKPHSRHKTKWLPSCSVLTWPGIQRPSP